MFPLEGIVLGDVLGQWDIWFVEMCGDDGMREHPPHARSVR
jgi:hypothetical protein